MRTQEAVQKAVQNEYNNTPERYFSHINHPEQPTTYARLDVLGNRCSIHLSYGAIGFKHTTYKQLSMSKTAVPKLIARIGIARFSKQNPPSSQAPRLSGFDSTVMGANGTRVKVAEFLLPKNSEFLTAGAGSVAATDSRMGQNEETT
jgi:hypothetical protein